MLRYAIVGCGLIGKKRAAHLKSEQVIACYDPDLTKAQSLAGSLKNCEVAKDLEELVSNSNIDAVIIATPNQFLAPTAKKVILANKHALIEKPGCVSLNELKDLNEASKQNPKVKIRFGYNHRYHPAFLKAYELFKAGNIGELMMIRARYGHGARVGYNKEWRALPRLSGGGELMDQGVHLIDLSQMFMGSFSQVWGDAKTLFWDMAVDDNAFMHLETPKKQVAWLQVSCSEWKNLFSFEIYGKTGKLHIEGLGGSYGLEKLHYYKMLPEMGPPETTIFEYPRGDQSWLIEMQEFEKDISEDRTVKPGLPEAIHAIEIVEKIYRKKNYPWLAELP